MRKLKLQMQVTVDGYVAGPEGQLDWMTFDMDSGLEAFINHLVQQTGVKALKQQSPELPLLECKVVEKKEGE